jgi:hypothetical protein
MHFILTLTFIFSKATGEKAIQLAYGTSVLLLRCLFVPEIMHGRAPEVFLNQ